MTQLICWVVRTLHPITCISYFYSKVESSLKHLTLPFTCSHYSFTSGIQFSLWKYKLRVSCGNCESRHIIWRCCASPRRFIVTRQVDWYLTLLCLRGKLRRIICGCNWVISWLNQEGTVQRRDCVIQWEQHVAVNGRTVILSGMCCFCLSFGGETWRKTQSGSLSVDIE